MMSRGIRNLTVLSAAVMALVKRNCLVGNDYEAGGRLEPSDVSPI